MALIKKNNVTKNHIGIRGRSFLAFAVLTIFTLLASIVGWISYNEIEDELKRAVQVNIYSLKLVEDLKEYGTTISIKAPTLYAAKDKSTQKKIWNELNQSIDAMLDLLPKNNKLNLDKKSQASINSQIKKLGAPLYSLNQNITEQLKIKAEKQEFSRNLRWQSSSFLNDIDNLILNTKKNSWLKESAQNKSIQSNEENLEILFRIKADFSLLANLIDRVQHLPDLSSLIAVRLHSNELVESLNDDLNLIKDSKEYFELKKAISDLVILAQGDKNIFSIRRKERDINEEGQLQLAQIRNDFNQLNSLLSMQSSLAESNAQESTQNVQKTIKQGRIWTIFLVGGSLLFSILIVWLYVGQNIVSRITHLNSSMRAIAKGHLDQKVPINGNDEITTMAQSLLSFRDQLSNLQEELVQSGKLAALGQLSAGIAHEINQPLSAIRHYTHNSSLLLEKGNLKEAQDNLKQITLLTKRIVSTITQLKSLAKEQIENEIVVDVQKAIDNAIIVLSGHKILSTTTLELNLVEEVFVYADPIQLEQVIVNLLTNALDAVVDIAEKRISIESNIDEDTVNIIVSDNGKGIPEELKNQVFDTFFTTKRRGQNLGLGLSISYNIVKNFGGKLSIDTELEEGCSFCINLPRHKKGNNERFKHK